MMVKIRDQVMLFVIQRVTSKQKMGYMVLVNICRNSTKKCWHKLSPLFATITTKLLSFSLKVSETANKPLPSIIYKYTIQGTRTNSSDHWVHQKTGRVLKQAAEPKGLEPRKQTPAKVMEEKRGLTLKVANFNTVTLRL